MRFETAGLFVDVVSGKSLIGRPAFARGRGFRAAATAFADVRLRADGDFIDGLRYDGVIGLLDR